MKSLTKKIALFFKFFIGVNISKKIVTLENSIVFTALNHKYCDNSKYLYEHLKINGYNVFYITNSPACPEGIKFGSKEHFTLIKNCSAVCFTHSSKDIATYIPKRVKKINLWHGSPIKKMGFDSPVDLAWLKKYKWLPLKNPYEKWDYIIIQSKFFLSAFCSALSCGTEKILMTGLPRNDILYYPEEKNKEKVLKKIGVPSGQEIILYAPTFRDEGDNITLHCEAIKKIFITHFPKKYLAIRLHPFDQSKIPKTLYSGNTIDANNIEDIQDILQVTNTLITDYSSVAFDFACSNKKIILYCPDRESYERSRGGLYFDIENLPFEYCETIDSLTNKIADDDTSYRYGEFGEHGACRRIESFMLAKNLIKSNSQSIKKGAI